MVNYKLKIYLRAVFVFIIYNSSFITHHCVAQKNDKDNKRITFGFSFGKGNPVRDYGNTSPSKLPMSLLTGQDTNRISGYAQLGFHFNVFATYKLARYVHVMLALNGDINSFDDNTLNAQYTPYFPPNQVAVFTQADYTIMQYLIGPKVSLPISKTCSIEFKALAGLTTSNYPPALIYFGVKDTVIYTLGHGKGFGYNLGVGLKYYLDIEDEPLGLGFHVNLSYAGSDIIYPNYTISPSNSTTVYTYYVPKHMALGILQLAVGVSLELFPPPKKQ